VHPRVHNDLFYQREDGSFEAARYEDGALLDGTGHRVLAADFDDDGWLDLYVLRRRDTQRDRPNALLRGVGDRRFVDSTEGSGLGERMPGISQDAVACDLDRDGDLDLVLAQGDHTRRTAPGGFRLYENLADRGPGRSVQFHLIGSPDSNPEAFSARLELHASGRRWIRDHWPAQCNGSAMPLPAHVGIGAVATVDSVIVRWPSGAVQRARDLPAGARYRWVEGTPPVPEER
jgi:hypothetical protein